jgi:membrane peptidoglycan carboxypeptidase
MPRTTDLIRQRQARRDAARQGTRRALRALAGSALSLAATVLLSLAAAGGVLAGVYTYYTRDLPTADALQAAFNPLTSEFFQTTRIYDRTDQHLLYEVIDPRGGDRQYLTFNQLPAAVISATVAIEDKTFFTNPGYDLLGIARALVSNLRGEPIQGGSSITQQLVKNTLIPLEQRAERSYSRKIREILLAAEFTRQFSKEQILEWYLNTNFYGNLAYGIDAAALVYFGKPATALTLGEAALLAAIPQSPGLNPVADPQAAFQRQAVVVQTMLAEAFITPEQATGPYRAGHHPAARPPLRHPCPPLRRLRPPAGRGAPRRPGPRRPGPGQPWRAAHRHLARPCPPAPGRVHRPHPDRAPGRRRSPTWWCPPKT